MTFQSKHALHAAAAVAFAAFGLTTALANDTAQSVYEAARKEGKVVLWTALDVSLHKRVAAKFNEKYPGIAVEAFKIFPGPAIERLITETKSLRIVHGYGTGQLRRAVAEFLKMHPLVSHFGPAPENQGAGGATVVELKD